MLSAVALRNRQAAGKSASVCCSTFICLEQSFGCWVSTSLVNNGLVLAGPAGLVLILCHLTKSHGCYDRVGVACANDPSLSSAC